VNFAAPRDGSKEPAHGRQLSDFSITLSYTTNADITLNPDNDGNFPVIASPTLATLPEYGGEIDNPASPSNLEGRENPPSQIPSAAVPDMKSSQTSRTSTVNGDEVSEEPGQTDEQVLNQDEGHELDVPGDEIDWENDGDDAEEQNGSAPTPSSVSQKRSRTNETESLLDGTGKFVRVC